MSSNVPLPTLPDASFRMLLEAAPDAMIIVDSSGSIVLVNGQTERMFGYGRGEMLGKKIEFLLPQRLRTQHVGHRDSYIAQPQLRPMGAGQELIAKRQDGSEFAVEISLSPVDTGDDTFVASVIRDVTSRKRMEQEIIAARQAAERANKANSAFLAAASHDLRQPVQALSLLNGALRRTVTDPRALGMIESQEHSLTAMTNLLNSLLDISRLDAGAVTPELEDFPIRRIIDRLSAEFGRQAHHKGLNFVANKCDAVVRSDPNLLAEIIQNLVSNAIRYTETGHVRMTCAVDSGYCRLHVVDSGVGIEPDQIDEIFREFVQCNAPGTTNEGFGLGLAIVRRLTDLLDIEIAVVSQPGRGSDFSIAIPVVDGVTLPAQTEAVGKGPSEEKATGLIILIEDDVSVANAWGMLLEAEGYRVATAASAAEAESVARHVDQRPQLLISDYHLLAGSTGVEAVEAIRRYYDHVIPAFIVSGDTSKVVRDARLLDNCTLLSKPVDTDQLLAVAAVAIETGRISDS
ncbi:MAG: PAS domain S-box protein [Gammaproteobacteria bacterium]|nr:PAS domain S-box protein [Gammaproteobacteria bacterium]